MSTRIIVEKDGERWELLSPDVKIINGDKIGSEDYLSFHSKFGGFQAVFLKRLPPVERTDNSEVIANLEAENAKLREALKPFVSLSDWLLKNAAPLGILDMVAKLREHGDRAREIMKGGAE